MTKTPKKVKDEGFPCAECGMAYYHTEECGIGRLERLSSRKKRKVD